MLLGFLFFGFWLGYAAAPAGGTTVTNFSPVVPDPAAAKAMAELKDKLAAAERAAEVEKASTAQNARHMAELESAKFRLEKEIALYKAILQPNAADAPKPGLSIAGFESTELGSQRYRFRLTLLNTKGGNKLVRGEVGLVLLGKVNGAAKSLNLAELAGLSGATLKYQFQHFHYLDGELVLPAAFQAEKVQVTVKPAEKGAKKLSKEYPWLDRS